MRKHPETLTHTWSKTTNHFLRFQAILEGPTATGEEQVADTNLTTTIKAGGTMFTVTDSIERIQLIQAPATYTREGIPLLVTAAHTQRTIGKIQIFEAFISHTLAAIDWV